MTLVIRIDNEVMGELKKRAIDLGLVFEPPNTTLRGVLGLDVKSLADQSVKDKQVAKNEIEIKLNPSARKYVLIPLPRDKRAFFPRLKEDFELITDAGVLTAHITSVPGRQIRARLGPWYAKHPELKAGDNLRIQALEPGKRYKLSTVDKVIDSNKEKVTPDSAPKAIADKIVKEVLEKYNVG